MTPLRVAARLAAVALALGSAAPGRAQSGSADSARRVLADSSRRIAVRLQTTVDPSLARTVDAEVRVATFELSSGAVTAALSRLEHLAEMVERDSMGLAAPQRAALHFLLAESYYRLGLLGPFRRAAEASLIADPARYAPVLRPQLVVEAYRSGDDARAMTLGRALPASEGGGPASLAVGLAAYRAGNLSVARSAFAAATRTGGDVASYARFMDALALLRTDSTRTDSALALLRSVASSAPPPFAEQARLTAAQVAVQGGRYEDAVRLADSVGDSGTLAAPALMTRAWALYRSARLEDAERAFVDYAARFPDREDRSEARLMAAQVQLELGRTGDAERTFQHVADSSAADAAALQAQTNDAITSLARALVADRAVALLGVDDPDAAKTLTVRDAVDARAAGAMLSAPVRTTSTPTVTLAATSASPRLDSLAAETAPALTRVVYTGAPDSAARATLSTRASDLAKLDAEVAVARHRLGQQLDAQQREVELLARLASTLDADSAAVVSLAAEYQAVADSMARLDGLMTTAEARVRELLGTEIEATRTAAAENARIADSLRATLAAGVGPEDRAALDAEAATAAAYGRLAGIAADGLDSAIGRQPVFVLRDSLHRRVAEAQRALAELRRAYDGSRADLASTIASLRSGDGPAARSARQALGDAEGRRHVIEQSAIAAVTEELAARAHRLVAALEHDAEAAQFGTASAAFFRAIGDTRALGETDSTGSSPERRMNRVTSGGDVQSKPVKPPRKPPVPRPEEKR